MPGHVLDYLDQATLLSQQATGRRQLTQLVWLYEHPLDRMALKRFHENFGYGLAGRRIAQSGLAFGRHRWVASVGPAADLDTADEPRPRSALSDWIDEQSQAPIDPETGPGWRLGVLEMTDGSAAVSLVGSHCLFDGVGFLQTIAQAVTGDVREIGYPAAGTTSRLRALCRDGAQVLRDAPDAFRALTAGVRLARRRRREQTSGTAPVSVAAHDDHAARDTIVLPAVSVFVDAADWDRAAEQVGGNGHSLLAAFSARLGARLHRTGPDSATVALLVALSDRLPGDTRANALRFARVDLDPAVVTTDLVPARNAIRAALVEARHAPDDTFALLPLTPFIPKRAVASMSTDVFGEQPVSCSNLGDVDPAVGRVDGTDADYVFFRPVDQNVSRAHIDSCGGHLVVVSARIGGWVSIGVVAYRPGCSNTRAEVGALVSDVVRDLGLTGVIM